MLETLRHTILQIPKQPNFISYCLKFSNQSVLNSLLRRLNAFWKNKTLVFSVQIDSDVFENF